jgi:hypothetical protein
VKPVAKGIAKGSKTIVKGITTTVKTTAKLARRGAQYVIRAGKVLLRGVSRGFSRGVKRLRALGAKLLERIRFKGFRIRRMGRRFILEGKINPWIKIAEGEIKVFEKPRRGTEFVDDDELDALMKGGRADADRLKELDARPYKETTAKGVGEVGDGLTGDHIPSFAALKKDFELRNPGKPIPESLLRDRGVTVVLKGTDHATLSRTYAGRNATAQILEDAMDLGGAFSRDAKAILDGLHRDGRLTMEVVGAYQKAYQANVLKGVFAYSAEVDSMLTSFIPLARK